MFFVILFPFILACSLLFVCMSSSLFYSSVGTFFVFPPWCMIAFCCSLSFWAWCCLFYGFIVAFLVICLFRCMIAFHCGLCTLLSFGHVLVFLIPPWFISFNQSKEFSFCCISFHLINQKNFLSVAFVFGEIGRKLVIYCFLATPFVQNEEQFGHYRNGTRTW